MRLILSGAIFVLVLCTALLPFVFYRLAAERGEIDMLPPLGVASFAVISWLVGWSLASIAADTVRGAKRPLTPRIPNVRFTRRRFIQGFFFGLTLALVSISMQNYPVYRSFVDYPLAYDLEDLFRSGWLVIAGGLISLVCGYKLVRDAKGGDDDA